MKVLITGITGFAGSHLAEYIVKNIDEVEVFGSVRWRSNRGNLSGIQNKVQLIECELRDATSVRDLIERIKPRYLFHLAGHSYVPASWNCPGDTMVNNIIGVINILEAVRKSSPDCRVMLACSSEEYGMVYENELPIKEDNPLRPLSPHGISKVAQDFLGYQYFQSYGLDIVRTRAFNHTGPRGGESFVASNFAKQIAEIELGMRVPMVYVGNLDAKRDFTDVRDVVRGYWLALQAGKSGEVYQICSGWAYTMRQVLDMLLSFTEHKIDVKLEPHRIRPSDVPVLMGSYKKFHRDTGWEPRIPFQQTVADLLQYWRTFLKNKN